jgi:hypothetical protein
MSAANEPPPRVLIVMAEQWPRAQLRAALREAGYDALGASDLDEALTYPAVERGRGPVRLVVLDQAVLQGGRDAAVPGLLREHGEPATLVLGSVMARPPSGPWSQVLQRPASIADIMRAVQALLELPATAHPID